MIIRLLLDLAMFCTIVFVIIPLLPAAVVSISATIICFIVIGQLTRWVATKILE